MAKVKKIFLGALFLRILLISVSGCHPDILNHVDWGIKFWEYGPKGFYEQIFWGVSWPNQPIGSIFLFALVAKLFKFIFNFLFWANLRFSFFPSFLFPFLERKFHVILLKIPLVFSDLGLGWLAYKIVKNETNNEKRSLLGAILLLFNPALIYNSAVWGQTDSLVNFFALSGLWLVFKEKFFAGIFLFLFGFYFKLSLLVWLPVFLFIIWQHRKSWRKIFGALLLVIFILLVVALPFVHHGNIFSWLWYLYTNRVLPRQGEMLSGNAFNFWTLVFGQDLSLKENILFLGFRAKLWGFLFLGTIWFLSFLRLLKREREKIIHTFFLMVILSYSSFLFLTNMHERYLYPIFFPLVILFNLGILPFGIYFWLTGIYLLNLYNLWYYPKINFIVSFLNFKKDLIPRLFSLFLILTFFYLILAYNRFVNGKKK